MKKIKIKETWNSLIAYIIQRDSSFFGVKSSNYSFPHCDSKLAAFTSNSYHGVLNVCNRRPLGGELLLEDRRNRTKVLFCHQLTERQLVPSTLKRRESPWNTRPQRHLSHCHSALLPNQRLRKRSSSCKRFDSRSDVKIKQQQQKFAFYSVLFSPSILEKNSTQGSQPGVTR